MVESNRVPNYKSDLDRWRVRPVERRDIARLVAIETHSFEFPWSAADFQSLRHDYHVQLLAACDDNNLPIGYAVVARWSPNDRQLLNLAVDRDMQRRGIGRALVNALFAEQSGQCTISLLVRETNLAAQLFFRQLGFRAIRVVHGCYEDSCEDGYLMRSPTSKIPTLNPIDAHARCAARDIDWLVSE